MVLQQNSGSGSELVFEDLKAVGVDLGLIRMEHIEYIKYVLTTLKVLILGYGAYFWDEPNSLSLFLCFRV